MTRKVAEHREMVMTCRLKSGQRGERGEGRWKTARDLGGQAGAGGEERRKVPSIQAIGEVPGVLSVWDRDAQSGGKFAG